jgi:hypothetical protein
MPRKMPEGGERPLSTYDNPLRLKNCTTVHQFLRCMRRFVGRTPWSAADAHVGFFCSAAQPDRGVRRGRGRPPYKKMELFPLQQ